MSKAKHLYIHIPFCKIICTYCDFKREILNNEKSKKYIDKICYEISKLNTIFKTIYIGGGTPNCIPLDQLEKLLKTLSSKSTTETEFTIELNPESLTSSQINIFKKYGVNRFSIGVQILNDKILKILNRNHNSDVARNAVDLLHKNNLDNISCDFIYNLPFMELIDIDNIIEFINNKNIKHASFYSLEIKEGSILNKQGYKVDQEKEEEFMEYLEYSLKKNTSMKQYEISNWCINENYQSKHNMSYWDMEDWVGIGYGATGYENRVYYENVGSVLSWEKKEIVESDEEYYKSILVMGLRKLEGIDLSIKRNKDAFEFYKEKLNTDLYIIKDNVLKCKNLNLLNSLLINLFD